MKALDQLAWGTQDWSVQNWGMLVWSIQNRGVQEEACSAAEAREALS